MNEHEYIAIANIGGWHKTKYCRTLKQAYDWMNSLKDSQTVDFAVFRAGEEKPIIHFGFTSLLDEEETGGTNAKVCV